MKKLPWYRRYVNDWRGGTRGMSYELRGFYSELLDMQWDAQGEISLDEKKIAMATGGCARSVRKLMPKLIEMGKIVKTRTGYFNPRMMADIQSSSKTTKPSTHAEFDLSSTDVRAELDAKVAEKDVKSIGGRSLPLPLPELDVEVESKDDTFVPELAAARANERAACWPAELIHVVAVGGGMSEDGAAHWLDGLEASTSRHAVIAALPMVLEAKAKGDPVRRPIPFITRIAQAEHARFNRVVHSPRVSNEQRLQIAEGVARAEARMRANGTLETIR